MLDWFILVSALVIFILFINWMHSDPKPNSSKVAVISWKQLLTDIEDLEEWWAKEELAMAKWRQFDVFPEHWKPVPPTQADMNLHILQERVHARLVGPGLHMTGGPYSAELQAEALDFPFPERFTNHARQQQQFNTQQAQAQLHASQPSAMGGNPFGYGGPQAAGLGGLGQAQGAAQPQGWSYRTWRY